MHTACSFHRSIVAHFLPCNISRQNRQTRNDRWIFWKKRVMWASLLTTETIFSKVCIFYVRFKLLWQSSLYTKIVTGIGNDEIASAQSTIPSDDSAIPLPDIKEVRQKKLMEEELARMEEEREITKPKIKRSDRAAFMRVRRQLCVLIDVSMILFTTFQFFQSSY